MKHSDKSRSSGEHLVPEGLLSICVSLFLAECAICEAAIAAIPSQQPTVVKESASGECFAGDAIKDAWRKPHEVLRFMGVKPGMHVLGYVSGGGYYSELLARAVGPTGSVIVSNKPYLQGVGGKVLAKPINQLNLKPNSLDGVLFVMAYHELYCAPKGAAAKNPSQVNDDLFRAVKPGGVIVVVDHVANPGTDSTQAAQSLQRIDPHAVKNDLVKVGFVFDGESTALQRVEDDHTKHAFDPAIRFRTDQFIVRFRKPIKK